MRDSERIDGKLYQTKELLEDERDLLLNDKAYYEKKRDSKQRKRDRKQK